MLRLQTVFTLFMSISLAVCMGCATGGPVANLAGSGDELFRIRDGRGARVSSCDPDWKNSNADARTILPGETLTIADIAGPGIIRHIWFTINAEDPRYGRSLTLRMYWDGAAEPAVESPLGDFFAVGHGLRRYVNSEPVSVTSEGRAYNCYWAMPFAKRAKITLSNDSKTHVAKKVYFYVDYEKVPSLPADTAYFHAQYRQEFPAKMGQNYLLCDIEGRGQYIGTVMSVYTRTAGWFGEGDDFFYVDGEVEPSIRGTGTEDYFSDAWGFREFCRPYYGVVVYDGDKLGDRVSVYRWHIKDPVRFNQSLKVEIEHKGEMNDSAGKDLDGCHERPDLFSSVAFWYQTGKAKRFATMPPAEQRVVPQTTVEFEDLLEVAEAEPVVEFKQTRWCFSGGRGMFARVDDPVTKVTVPFKVDTSTQGVARMRLGTMPDGGLWSVKLDGKTIQHLAMVDLYSADVQAKRVKIGMVDLAAGEHTITFECKSKNGASRAYSLGVDSLTIDHITPYALPAEKK